jgi:hypothetical protein
MIRITVSRPGIADQTYSFEQPEITIGRSSSCNLTLNEPGISGTHAHITATADGCVVQDARSTNGTFVNGQPATSPIVVSPADEVYIGMFRLSITRAPDQPVMPSPVSSGWNSPPAGSPYGQVGQPTPGFAAPEPWQGAQVGNAPAWPTGQNHGAPGMIAPELSTITPPSLAAGANPELYSVPPPSALRPTNIPTKSPAAEAMAPRIEAPRSFGGSTGTIPPPSLLELPHPIAASGPPPIAGFASEPVITQPPNLGPPPVLTPIPEPKLEAPALNARPFESIVILEKPAVPLLSTEIPLPNAGLAPTQSNLATGSRLLGSAIDSRGDNVLAIDLHKPADPFTDLCELECESEADGRGKRLRARLFAHFMREPGLGLENAHASAPRYSRDNVVQSADNALVAAGLERNASTRAIAESMADEVLGCGPLTDLLRDTSIDAVEVVGTQRLRFRRQMQWHDAQLLFSHPLAVEVAYSRLSGAPLDPHKSAHIALLPAGWTMRMVSRNGCVGGPMLWLNRKSSAPRSLNSLLAAGVISASLARVLNLALIARTTLLVAHAQDIEEPLLCAALLDELAKTKRVALVRSRRDLVVPNLPVLDAVDSPEEMETILRWIADLQIECVLIHEPLKGALLSTWTALRRAGVAVILSVRAERAELACAQLDSMLKSSGERGAPTLAWLSLVASVGTVAGKGPRLRELAEVTSSPLQPSAQMRTLTSSRSDEIVIAKDAALALVTRWHQAGHRVDPRSVAEDPVFE